MAQAPPIPEPPPAGFGAIVALVLFIAASVWLGTLAQKVVERSQFIQGYFQGNRGLGAWTIALTATVQSGGTFMGTPSLIYTYGWIVALWIGSYMVVPITGFGLLGKRIAQISRRTGAVTMPDLFRARYGSPTDRPDHVAADHRLHVDHDDRPVQSRGAGDEDRLAGLADAGADRGRPDRTGATAGSPATVAGGAKPALPIASGPGWPAKRSI